MARIFITGSSDGLGSLAAQSLVKKKHQVVLHARNQARAKDAQAACPGAETVLIADLSNPEETKKLAEEVNKLGPFDAVIHNAGLYTGPFRKTKEGSPALFMVNTLAPYILTCLIKPPKRLVYISSGLHTGGDESLHDLTWFERGEKRWNDMRAYSDSKLHNVMFAFAFARKWPNVASNAVDPGWVATKMGGPGAPEDINAAVDTYTMLAEGEGAAANVTGKYFKGRGIRSCKAAASDIDTQERLFKTLEEVSGVKVPQQSS